MSDNRTRSWRDNMPCSVLDPHGPRGEPVETPTDRRMLWHLEGTLSVLATTDMQRDLLRDLRQYLHETCEHHWLDYAASEWSNPVTGRAEDLIPAHRQCLWCCAVEDAAGAK